MKGKINFIIDALMLLLMAAVSGLGFLMKYIMVPGKDRIVKFGRQVDLYFLGLDRHEWGTIHLALGFVLLGLLVLHIVLHWQTVLCLFRRLVRSKPGRIVWTAVFSFICLFLFFFPFAAAIEVRDIPPGQGHHAAERHVLPDFTNPGAHSGPVVSERLRKHAAPESRPHPDGEIHGFMTLREVSDRYGVPVSVILSGLHIPETIPPDETLGRLKKRYDFRMSDVETLVRGVAEKTDGQNR